MSISTEGVGGGSTSIHAGSTVSKAKQTLDGETFLNLLVAQLRYQDPSAPMDTTEMMAQTTQLASMEKLTSIADATLETFALQMRATAAEFVGKDVSYTDAAGKTVNGHVSSVSFAGSVPELLVDGVKVSLDSVSGILGAPAEKPAPTPPTDSSAS